MYILRKECKLMLLQTNADAFSIVVALIVKMGGGGEGAFNAGKE